MPIRVGRSLRRFVDTRHPDTPSNIMRFDSALNSGSAPDADERRLRSRRRRLAQEDLDAPVLRAAGVGVVVGDRLPAAPARRPGRGPGGPPPPGGRPPPV